LSCTSKRGQYWSLAGRTRSISILTGWSSDHETTQGYHPVHFGGQRCEMRRILEIAEKHNLKVVEDAAQPLPASERERFDRGHHLILLLSIYATKTITTGEGG
jgi:dTDP-4-amino-4,6-dideoxygalactose transaminase